MSESPVVVEKAVEPVAVKEVPVHNPQQYAGPPPMMIQPEQMYTATVVMENGEVFTIELYPEEAPVTVNNFVFLAQKGFYDGVTFHRVIEGFMAQAGDPTGTGTGGPGYRFENEVSPLRRHDAPVSFRWRTPEERRPTVASSSSPSWLCLT